MTAGDIAGARGTSGAREAHDPREPQDARVRVLVVDDEENVLLTLGTILADRGYAVELASSGRQAIEKVAHESYALVLTDLAMKECDGLEVLAAVRLHQPDAVAIMLTGYASLDSAIEAIRRGAYDYLTKPANLEEMCQTIERGLEKRRLTLELRRRVEELAALHRLANLGVDEVIRSTRDSGRALGRIAEIVAELLAPAGGVLFLLRSFPGGAGTGAGTGAGVGLPGAGPGGGVVGGGATPLPPARLEPRVRLARSEAVRPLLDDPGILAIAREALRSGRPVQQPVGAGVALAVPVEGPAIRAEDGEAGDSGPRRRYGALVVVESGTRPWNDEQVETAATIAGRAGLAIENHDLYRRVAEEKETLRHILDAAGDGIVGVDGEGRIAFFGRTTERLTGLKEAELRGRPIDELGIDRGDGGETFTGLRARAAVVPGGFTAAEIVIRGAGGLEILCDARCSYLSPLGRGDDDAPGADPGASAVRWVIALQDARERRRQEELKTTAFSHLTHELKTPLTSILAYTDLLVAHRLGALGPRQGEALKVMQRNGRHLLSLIENMLTIAKITQGVVEYDLQPLRLSSLLGQARESFEPVAADRQVGFLVETQGDPEVRGDRAMLSMALNNLLLNAFKFTERGGRVRAALSDRGDEAWLVVEDTGVGIAEEHHQRIFHGHFQVDKASGGSGLGLKIVRSIAEAHGGRCWVESRPGAGARFYVALPKARAAVAPAQLGVPTGKSIPAGRS